MLLTAIFWLLLLAPGLALDLGCLLGLTSSSARVAEPAGMLARIARGYVASFLLLSPVSLLCYVFSAPLWVFSSALCGLVLWGAVSLLRARPSRRATKGRWALAIDAGTAGAILLGLLWLQARNGSWLDGDATYHVARIRVLLQHGFSNRDVYLSEYRFQHAYHSNLLLPIYASLAQLTHQSELTTWFFTEPWAKLLIAAGHAVLGERLTGRRSVGRLLAVCILVLNAGETYALYPNTLCVGWLLPSLLAAGFDSLSRGTSYRGYAHAAWLAALMFVMAQVHAMYAVYSLLTLGPVLALAALWPGAARKQRFAALVSLAVALPFIAVSALAFRDPEALVSAPADVEPPAVVAPGPAGLAEAPNAQDPTRPPPDRTDQATPLLAGHLEKVLDPTEQGQVIFKAERMGGIRFVAVGFACLVLAALLYAGRRLQLLAAVFVACFLAVILFSARAATLMAALFQGHFLVARLSTVLTTLLVFGVCACVMYPVERLRKWPVGRALARGVLYAVCAYTATGLTGHAPVTFQDHVRQALAPSTTRYARLFVLAERRELLRTHVPAGTRLLTTPRFGRQAVMLCDCYVLAADRGHTYVVGVDKRRRDLMYMNAADTPWPARERLIRHYGLRIVTFESRWSRRYAWAYEHGRLLGR
ncbi:MAG: hypothetical protein RL701_6390, partial [Pseudomonadota bacterium]